MAKSQQPAIFVCTIFSGRVRASRHYCHDATTDSASPLSCKKPDRMAACPQLKRC